MAKICFYCGKELAAGERCNCRTATSGKPDNSGSSTSSASSASSSSSSSHDAKSEKHAREEQAKRTRDKQSKQSRAKEQERFYKQSEKKAKPKFNWQSFLLRLMTSSGYEPNDKLPRKIGYSLLQCLIRPVNAIETFVQRQDFALSIFYLVLFSLATGLATSRFSGFTLTVFAEGFLIGAALALILNGLFILAFRFLGRIRFSFRQIISAFSAPAFFYSLFFLFAATGRTTIISFIMTIMAGVVAGSILHFLSVKSLARQTSEQVVVNVILVYVIFFSIAGIILNLVSPALMI
ncbi:MAG: hypothetical protein ACYCYI_03320 [Saccharofermentanales bacterium]